MNHPPFELQSYEDESLPIGERFTGTSQLVGHTIKAVSDCAVGRLADGSELVIVTETGCWLVLRPEAGYTCEDGADITVVSDRLARRGEAELLSDYLTADEMRRLGLANTGEYAAIKAKEDELKNAERQRKADILRKELAALEAGKS